MRFGKSILTTLAYYLAIPFIYLASIMPFALLYLISDSIFLVIYYCWGYRKLVVSENLRLAFPEKPDEEIKNLSSVKSAVF